MVARGSARVGFPWAARFPANLEDVVGTRRLIHANAAFFLFGEIDGSAALLIDQSDTICVSNEGGPAGFVHSSGGGLIPEATAPWHVSSIALYLFV